MIHLTKLLECTVPGVNHNVVMSTVGFGGSCRVIADSSVVTAVPLWCGMLLMGEAGHEWGQGIWEIPVPSL